MNEIITTGVLPSVEDVARIIANSASDWVDSEHGEHSHGPECSNWAAYTDDAREVIALLPGRTEAAVKAEALRGAGGWQAEQDDCYLIAIDARRLTWDRRIPTAAELTEWIEYHTPAGEFSTGLLAVADALREREARARALANPGR